MNRFIAYTDGAYSRKQVDGGFGIMITGTDNPSPNNGGEVLALVGGYTTCDTTSNQMELTALIGSLILINDYLDDHPEIRYVDVYTDSEYAMKALTEWCHSWIKNGWRNYARKAVVNKEIIQFGLTVKANLEKRIKLKIKHVHGHAGHAGNETVDDIAILYRSTKRENDFLTGMTNSAEANGFTVDQNVMKDCFMTEINDVSYITNPNVSDIFESVVFGEE